MVDNLESCRLLEDLDPYIRSVTQISDVLLLKLGSHGIMLCSRLGSSQTIKVRHYLPSPSIRAETIVNVTGAGDSLVGAVVAGISYHLHSFEENTMLERFQSLWNADGHEDTWDRILLRARHCAEASLQSDLAVNPEIIKYKW
jgi:sugar/nucleoside kinase (ribokinase family)